MQTMTLSMMFQSVGLFYGLMIPIIVLVLLAFLTLPMAFRPSIRAESICRAVYCKLAQMLGILLMTAGGLPALHAAFTGQPLSELTYIGFLIVFAAGGLLFLWHDGQLRHIDPASKAIPEALFFTTWKFVGLLVTVTTILSLFLRLMLVEDRSPNWWVVHMVMLLYGLLLSWFTMGYGSSDAPTTPEPKPALTPIVKKPAPAPSATKRQALPALPATAKPMVPAKKTVPVKKTQK